MRLWYRVLLVVTLLGFVLLGIGFFLQSMGEYQYAFTIQTYGSWVLAVPWAVGFLYVIRWSNRMVGKIA